MGSSCATPLIGAARTGASHHHQHPGIDVLDAHTQWIEESPTNAMRAQAINVGRPNDFRALLAYRARPLTGIWATAPYLHNGSVPSLYQLLLPANQRSKVFFVGNWEFNPELVGFESDSPFEGAFQYDTALPGNSNAGHEFGTDLNDNDRRALIEYLKTL